jgi:hypothetical protein
VPFVGAGPHFLVRQREARHHFHRHGVDEVHGLGGKLVAGAVDFGVARTLKISQVVIRDENRPDGDARGRIVDARIGVPKRLVAIRAGPAVAKSYAVDSAQLA